MVRVLTLLVVAAVLGTAGCGSGGSTRSGTAFAGGLGKTVAVKVATGDRFSLSLRENASIGDNWDVTTQPDPKIATFAGEEYDPDSDEPMPGSGGTRHFVYTAKAPGTTSVVIYNCWRCSTGHTPMDDMARANSGNATFEITVS